MFNFIGDFFETITNFFRELIVIIIIVLAVALLLLAAHRHRNNPYADHTKERIEQQIEAEKEAKYQEVLKRIYEENLAK